ncbi:MAG: hypothetical protein V4525_02285 [Pseudomonadota bacterium]
MSYSSVSSHRYSKCLWFLLFLFALRVVGQALQRWLPLSFLPPFSAFQGSHLPYWLLLSIQLLILSLMVHIAWKAQRGKLSPNHSLSKYLRWLGSVYMAGALGRIAIGLLYSNAPSWFSTWIPAAFHIVLAAFVLTLGALYHSLSSSKHAL